MINWKSILSSFNDKPTLLEWLKLVEKALKESVLQSVTTEQDANKDNTKLIFNFEDGTKIETDFFPTKGEAAPKITSIIGTLGPTIDKLTKTKLTFYMSDGKSTTADAYARTGKAVESFTSVVKEVTDENTVNTITVNYDDKTSNTFDITSVRGKQGATGPAGPTGTTGATGPKGADGVSITGIDTVSDEVVGDETLTTLRAHYSNNTTDEFVVTAKNGTSNSLYFHKIRVSDGFGDNNVTACFINYSSKKVSEISEIDAVSKILFDIKFEPTASANKLYICNFFRVENNQFSVGYFSSYPFTVPVTVKKFDLGLGKISDEVTVI